MSDLPSVDEILSATADERRRDDARAAIELITRTTGAEARVWGPSIVGFGHAPYTTADAKVHDWFAVGLSPRKAALTFYGLLQDGPDELLDRSDPTPPARAASTSSASTPSTPPCSARSSRGPGGRSTYPTEARPAGRSVVRRGRGCRAGERLVVPLVQALADLGGVVVAADALVAGDGGTGGDAGQDTGESEQLPRAHAGSVVPAAHAGAADFRAWHRR